MITEVRLKNWRSHLDSNLVFSEGTNALLGHMGAGKTSILDSICFCFFGTFPSLNSKKLKLDDLIMKKPVEKDRAEVEVKFSLNGKNYIIKRIIEKGKGTTFSEIRENGNILESPSTQRVTEIIERILKINYDLFSKAIYSEQNSLDYFLNIPKGQRMKKIDELLSIDKFEKTRANVTTLINKFLDKKSYLKNIADSIDFDEELKKFNELNHSINSLLREKDKILEEYSFVSNEKSKIENQVKNLEKLNLELNSFKTKEESAKRLLEEFKNTLRNLEKDLNNLSFDDIKKNLENLENELNRLKIQFEERKKSLEVLNKSVTESKAKLSLLKSDKIESLQKQLEMKLKVKSEYDEIRKSFNRELDVEIEDKKQLYNLLISEFHQLKTRIEELNDVIDNLNSLESVCPICDSKLTPEKKRLLLNQKESQLNAFKKQLEKVAENKELNEKELKKLEEASKKLSEMFSVIKDIELIQSELDQSKHLFASLSDSTIKTENDLSELKRELEDLNRHLEEKQKLKQDFEIKSLKIREHTMIKNKIDKLNEELLDTESRIEKIRLNFFDVDLASLRDKLNHLIGLEKELEGKLKSSDQIAKEKKIRAEEIGKKIGEYEKAINELKRIEKLSTDLKIFQMSLQETQIELRKEFVDTVNFTMNNLWNTLYPYKDFIGIRLNVEEGDYVLQLQEKYGNWINVEGIASGGERSLAALALRVAFSLVLAPQLRMLILDEPTANLDSKAISELATTLRERIGDYIDQTFLITHQSELEEAVTGNAYRLEREKERDGPTKTIQLI